MTKHIKNIFDYSFGLIMAQIIGIFSLPVITRLFSPEEFGNYSLVVQISIFISIFIALRKEQTIIIENDKNIIFNEVEKNVSLINKKIFAMFFFIFIEFVFTDSLRYSMSIISSLILVSIGYLNAKLLFIEEYKSLGASELANKLFFSLFSIITIHMFNFYNLLFGYFLALYVKYLILKKTSNKSSAFVKLDNYSTRKSNKAGLSVALSHVLLSVSTIIPMISINNFFDVTTLGQYSLAITVIFLPGSVIGITIGNVFYEKLSKDSSKFPVLYYSFFLISISLSLFIFIPFFIFSSEIFRLLFGQEWILASYIAAILSIPAFLGFVSGTFDRTCIVVGNNYHGPIWHFARAFLICSICFYATIFKIDFIVFIYYLATSMSLLYIIDLILQTYYGFSNYARCSRKISS